MAGSEQRVVAVIMVGGPTKGTRFRPLSLNVPKPLFPLTGQPMVHHPISACRRIWEHWTMKTITEMIDPYLRSDSSRDEILRCVHIGLSCVQEDPVDRPTMSAISIMLDSSTVPSQAPSRPAFYIEMSGNVASGMYSQSYPGVINESTPKPTVMSPNELSITDPEPR